LLVAFASANGSKRSGSLFTCCCGGELKGTGGACEM
jgi:hypothetical protein